MASHAIFQYNVLAIDGIHNTWTNMIVKMIILRHLGSSDDKEKIGVLLSLERQSAGPSNPMQSSVSNLAGCAYLSMI